jgi:hypothetical protein
VQQRQAKLKKLIERGIAIARSKGYNLAADNFQHWLNGTSSTKVIPATYFVDEKSGVPSFLAKDSNYSEPKDKGALRAFKEGITARLRDSNHPQGTLRPASLVKDAKGPIRFLQFENGVTPSLIEDLDLFLGLGSFYVHSVIWAQATWLGQSDGFSVEILKWCVQIYDVYDWNAGKDIAVPITNKEESDIKKEFPQLPNGVTIELLIPVLGPTVLKIKDNVMRNLEVSGIGRAYLIRSETFEAPPKARASFKVKV